VNRLNPATDYHTVVKLFSCALVCALGLLFFVFGANRVEAQTQTATISGTATDPSGGALVGAKVQVTNVGTNVEQATVTDGQGRYEVADLPIGTYDIQASLSGFQTVTHKGVTLTVGAHPLVDFALPVGEATQNVTVEGQVSQVETQSATVSSLVSQTQLEQLPLNGRNYTQLLELAPGVQSFSNSPGGSSGPGGGGTSGSFYGNQTSYSFAGSRPEGQAFLLDNEDVRDFWEHGPGSAALGTALGVEGISEFQILTNTYGAQFGGNGAVVNEASKSGSNEYHGSGYEFLRNSALDSRNFFDFTGTGGTNADGSPTVTPNEKPEFRQNQFGGSVGGPIEKDKLFFFANYEGLRNFLGTTVTSLVPEPYVSLGELPCANQAPANAACPADASGTPGSATNPILPIPGGLGSGAGGQSIAAASTLAQILALYPTPNSTAGTADRGGYSNFTNVNTTAQSENYVIGRIDYNLSSKDTVFGRYVSDRSQLSNPFAGSPVLADWPEVANSANQYFTLQERRIVSATVVNEIRFNFTRTFETANTTTTPDSALQFVPGFPDGSITAGCPGCAPLGANTGLPYILAQNKIGGGDDLVWTHGSHSFKVGVSITRVQSNIYAPFVYGGDYIYFGEQSFMTGNPFLFLGTYPGHDNSRRNFREVDYAPYFEDDWKVTSRLTLNLGVRYDYATNPTGGPFTTIVNAPFPDTNNYFTAPGGASYATGYTPVRHIFQSNPNAENFEPRIGVAFDPFSNHKTSIRAGFGLFHDQVAPRTYASASYLSFPYASADFESFAQNIGFPNPFPGVVPGGPTAAISEFAGVNYLTGSSPYVMQYNLTIQRQITPGTVLSVGYIGSEGRHLFTEVDLNAPMCATSAANEAAGIFTTGCQDPASTYFANGATFAQNPRISTAANPQAPTSLTSILGPGSNAYFGQLSTAVAQQTSNYNSLQISLNHQFSRSFSGQASYTYSKCLGTGSASSGLEQDIYEQADPYDRKYDYGLCSFDIRHNFVANGVYSLPFRGNRLVEGWQVSSILRANTGLPVTIQEGADVTDLAAIQGDRPDYSGTCPGGRDQDLGKWYNWFNSTCYTSQPFGTLGDVPRGSVTGPGLVNLDFSLIKNTKVWEGLNAQFRAEFYNVLNHTNFAQPLATGVLTGAAFAATAAPTGQPGDSGSIEGTATTSREIQFGLKLTF
jgi:hypothetical protein